jgi:hypothetical protein
MIEFETRPAGAFGNHYSQKEIEQPPFMKV